MNNASCPSFCVDIRFSSPAYVPRSGITGLRSNSMFNLLRKCPNVSQSDCIILHYQLQYVSVLISPHCRRLLLTVFLVIAIVGVRRYLTGVLMCSSLITKDLCMYLLAICLFCLEKCLFRPFTYFLFFDWAVGLLSWKSFIYTTLKLFIKYMVCKDFSSIPLVGFSLSG